MSSVLIPVRDLDEVKEESAKVLAHRQDRIADGKLGHSHWFLAICAEAADLVRRRQLWDLRRHEG